MTTLDAYMADGIDRFTRAALMHIEWSLTTCVSVCAGISGAVLYATDPQGHNFTVKVKLECAPFETPGATLKTQFQWGGEDTPRFTTAPYVDADMTPEQAANEVLEAVIERPTMRETLNLPDPV